MKHHLITMMRENAAIKTAFYLYEFGWRIAIPFLKKKPRISDGFNQRIYSSDAGKADIWIQSASAGESYLTWEILKTLAPGKPVNIHLTSNTRQGIDILERAALEVTSLNNKLLTSVSFSPFDRPSAIERAVRTINPDLMVLVELEMWPGLLRALKKNQCSTIIINGRLTEKSLKGYLLWPTLWKFLAPDKILAISENDTARFKQLFPNTDVSVMPNIKFDRLTVSSNEQSSTVNPLSDFFSSDRPVIVLGSVREEEEKQIENIIFSILSTCPEVLICLFPRHMHRQNHWASRLTSMNLSWTNRSSVKSANQYQLILWDTFGELGYAYQTADAAFIGGSLAPLGGQNFLEALACGVVPVIGPSWDNFSWAGENLIEKGLLHVEQSWRGVAERLVTNLSQKPPKELIQKKATEYLETRKGGARLACNVITKHINGDD